MIQPLIPDVTKLPLVNKDDILLTEDGYMILTSITLLHRDALEAHYGRDFPDCQFSVEPDGVLTAWWPCGDWPLLIRIDDFDWAMKSKQTLPNGRF